MKGLVLPIFIALLAAPAASGGGNPRLPAMAAPLGLTLPNYFSGTDSRFSVSTGIFGNNIGYNWFKVTMTCNGESLSHEVTLTYPNNLYYNQHANISAMFDSSHFPDGATVTVTAQVTDVFGNYYAPKSASTSVKNKVLIAEHPDLIDGAETTSAEFIGQNYGQNLLDNGFWTPSAYFQQMNGCNVIYGSVHGNVDEHASGNYPSATAPDRVYTGAVSYSPPRSPNYDVERASQLGTGYPPFNSTSQPPIKFMFLYACLCGSTNNFIRACWPYDNYYGEWGAYGPWGVNQSVVDYFVEANTADAGRTAHHFMGKMLGGYLAEDAIAAVIAASATETIQVSDNVSPLVWRRPVRDDFRVWGDPYTRVKTVYTYDSSAPSANSSARWIRWS